jgi:hypothetical protein
MLNLLPRVITLEDTILISVALPTARITFFGINSHLQDSPTPEKLCASQRFFSVSLHTQKQLTNIYVLSKGNAHSDEFET